MAGRWWTQDDPRRMIRTERLLLRQWKESDTQAFAALNADPVVMEFFPRTQTPAESAAAAGKNHLQIATHGWGLWAAEILETGEFAGFIGLWQVTFEAHFTPAVEVGWRLAHRFWGRGYAPEGGAAALAFAFDELGLDEVVSMTAVGNQRSRRVMEKLGMTHDPADDFEHPYVAVGHVLRPHVLYRVGRNSSTVS
jgi:RimJ/RimL family protein N-acetyltransferase